MRRLIKFVIPALILTALPVPAAFAASPPRGWRDRLEDRWDRREDRRDRREDRRDALRNGGRLDRLEDRWDRREDRRDRREDLRDRRGHRR